MHAQEEKEPAHREVDDQETDRDRGLGAFAGLAQRRFRAQLAGLDHDAAILDR